MYMYMVITWEVTRKAVWISKYKFIVRVVYLSCVGLLTYIPVAAVSRTGRTSPVSTTPA